MNKIKKIDGFTLIEILIALMIFAILGVMIAVGLQRLLATNQHVDAANQRLQDLEIAQVLMRRDMSEIVDRPITDPDGQPIPAVVLTPNTLDFTRGGVINPLGINRSSDLQRIEYTYKNNQIIRTTWPTLDRMSNTVPSSMTVLTQVTDFNIQVFDHYNTLQSSWPYDSKDDATLSSSTQKTDLPKAIKITFTLQNQGSIEDIIPIPSRGLVDQNEENNAAPPTS